MRYTFKCGDSLCGHAGEVVVRANKRIPGRLKCPACGKPNYRHDLMADLVTVVFDREKSAYNGRFPYQSLSFPRGSDSKPVVVQSAEHERSLRREYNFVGESGLTHSGLDRKRPSRQLEFGAPQAAEIAAARCE